MKKSIKEYTYNMGAINSAFNQGLGSVVGALAVGKKLSQEKQVAEGIKAANEEKAIELESKDLVEQEAAVAEADESIRVFMEENTALGSSAEPEILAEEEASGEADLPNSLTKAREALDNMEKQRQAKITLRDLTKKRIETLRGGKK